MVSGDGEDHTSSKTKDKAMSIAALSPQDNQYQTTTSGGLLQIVSIDIFITINLPDI